MDEELHRRISTLVEEEHELRGRHARGELSDAQEQSRMRELEVALDRTWDLLRQREALRRAGQDPAAARERDAATVEGYLG